MDKHNFTGAGIDTFRFEFASAIAEFEKKNGVKFNLGRITYDAKQFSCKLTVTIVAKGENAEEAILKTSLKRHGWKFGLSEKDFNRRIEFMGKVYSIKGVKERKQRCPIIAKQHDNGVVYKLPPHCLK